MNTRTETLPPSAPGQNVAPLCPVFGPCGGCKYQDISYEAELRLKERDLKQLLQTRLGLGEDIFEPIVASPEDYHYRSRLDITLKRTREGLVMGFQSVNTHRMVAIESCAIARREISDFIPELRRQAEARLPADYRTANLVVKTGDNGRIVWGGIGRKSLALSEKDYLWTEIHGKRIYFSLDNFFQANLSILPLLMDCLARYGALDKKTVFFDLYAGVGLFGIYFADRVAKTVMIEDDIYSVKLMRFNVAHHRLSNAESVEGKTEALFPAYLAAEKGLRRVAIVDPPRRGLSPSALRMLAEARQIDLLFYLSCHPGSLARDLAVFAGAGWAIDKIIPFDFFPRTEHLETLAVLRS